MPNIGRINIDFQVIDSGDPKILMIGDFSDWAHIVNEPAVISITMPGAANPIQYNFVKNNINGFNSNTLGITCDVGCNEPDYLDLPDGIYEICLEGSPNTFRKMRYYLKLDSTRLELDKQIVKLGFKYSEDYDKKRQHLELIDWLLTLASSSTRLEEIPEASEYFQEALKMLEKYKDCKTCF